MTYFEKPATPADALEHYGVPGMKWGVRRSPEQLRARRTVVESKRKKAVKKAVKTTAAVDRANVRQNQAMVRMVKKNRRRDRKLAAKRLNQTNRAIRRDEKVDRYIKRLDKKITKLDRKIIDAGEREALRMLEELKNG